ncbi:unnamed protein product [Closterium sp. NIES-64]|nr:unnamed protein product [Closterium sp. NIES-64]CAI5982107.1 unnamed protein product [Closterium sp. NIES-65]
MGERHDAVNTRDGGPSHGVMIMGGSSARALGVGRGAEARDAFVKARDEELWHVAAGSLAMVPAVGSLAVYFPQGHIEQQVLLQQRAQGRALHGEALEDLSVHLAALPADTPLPPSHIFCRVTAATLQAHPDTDSVCAALQIHPIDEVNISPLSYLVNFNSHSLFHSFFCSLSPSLKRLPLKQPSQPEHRKQQQQQQQQGGGEQTVVGRREVRVLQG